MKKLRNCEDLSGFTHRALWSPFNVVHVQGNYYTVYFFPGILWQLLKYRPHVVVTEGEYMMLNNVLIFLYAKLFRAKVVWWSLGKVVTRPRTIVNTMFDWLIRWQIKNSTFIVGRNSQALRYYDERYAILKTRMIVAPNTVDDIQIEKDIAEAKEGFSEWRSQFEANDSHVLFVGAMESTKRIDVLLEAMMDVWKITPNAHLILVGDGDVKSQMEDKVKKLGVEQKVTFTAKVFSGISRYFMLADVVVLPGLGGLAIPHAMAHGVPVIAGQADGTEFDLIVDGETGFLLGQSDAASLAEKILLIIGNDAIRQEMEKNCLSIIRERWNIRNQVSCMEEAIRKSVDLKTTIGKCNQNL